MKKLLVVFGVMALPHVLSVSTVCNAGTYCSSDPVTGRCTTEHMLCGSYSQGKGCTSSPNPNFIAASAKRPPQGITPYMCQCGS